MNEPIRYRVEGAKMNPDLASVCITFVRDETGDLVKYADYACLKAEVDALKLGSLLTAVDVLQFIKLKEENERLREAGDEMAGWVGKEWCPSWVVKDWNAAKEGKPSV